MFSLSFGPVMLKKNMQAFLVAWVWLPFEQPQMTAFRQEFSLGRLYGAAEKASISLIFATVKIKQ
ncbi:hypothetical protein [Agrobacterium tumefaciens]|uniref:hypothetical protein n=1 Tax=Agrobacterium tumefaciens TaxID=358 RepID=UPI00287E055D|nr:hypothetical protein [Agrobacterium tumefaciens]MDS7596786.1 hypothetical protein [Agrobacterium tumefaciens]